VTGLAFQRLRLHDFRWYLIVPGAASWLGFALAGLHPALGLLPIIPTIPHANVNKAHDGWDVIRLADRRNQFEHWLKNPVEIVLGLFALFNAGVSLSNVGAATYLVGFGLLLGKPLGIFLTGAVSVRLLGLRLPDGLTLRHLVVLGCVAGIGFTVAIFVATVAFPPGQVQDAAKMGALASFAGAITGWLAARVMRGVRRAP
jgi:NhaA family Na+:H+ antiporter